MKQQRWTVARKEALLSSIDCGTITAAEAMLKHQISVDELAEWRNLRARGPGALRVTKRPRGGYPK